MNSFPIHYSLSRDGLPLIVTSSKPTLCFLIDTGTTHNVLLSMLDFNIYFQFYNKTMMLPLWGLTALEKMSDK